LLLPEAVQNAPDVLRRTIGQKPGQSIGQRIGLVTAIGHEQPTRIANFSFRELQTRSDQPSRRLFSGCGKSLPDIKKNHSGLQAAH